MNLYEFYWDCGRMGNVGGVFTATEEEVNDAIGREVYLGEVLGKHSEIEGILEVRDITKIPASDAFIKEFNDVIGCVGINILECIREDEK